MFERRLKIFLILLFVMTIVIALKAAHIQVIEHDHWSARAEDLRTRTIYVETTRGRILDRNGEELAVDMPCTDVAVDYRAITPEPDPRWVRSKAYARLRARDDWDAYLKADRATRRQLLDAEIEAVKADIEAMWDILAELSGESREQIDETRNAIVQRVEMRKRYIWYKSYERAVKKHEEAPPPPIWQRWLLGDNIEGPKLDQFRIEVAEETQSHVIISDIDVEAINYLGKNIDRFPGLSLRPGVHRVYPFRDVAAHVLGRIAKVTREDLEKDPNRDDELRKYWQNDLIGRTGIEALAEPTLRGSRGRMIRHYGQSQLVEDVSPVPGKDVRITLDIHLQKAVQETFERARVPTGNNSYEVHPMHGAAVVIDVPTGEIRALVSYPTYDLNTFDRDYPRLVRDDINKRLLNRATQYPLEPGSTIKPVVGIGAIADGLIEADGTIECTGYLVLDGRTHRVGRCWVASKFATILGPNGVAHHPIPWSDPHPTGHLNLSDALKRSCNVYFETLADKMGLDGLSKWYREFGLGMPVGIGIPESSGRLPDSFRGPADVRRATAWFASIGQGQVSTTPLQMANVAATIARNGLWIRPTLIPRGTEIDERLIRRGEGKFAADERRIVAPAAAWHMARNGMERVVNDRGGTAWTTMHNNGVDLAVKTGTAQAAKLTVPVRDENGEYLRDERGRVVRRLLEPSTPGNPNPEAIWYRAFGEDNKQLNHAWMIGYAPAKNPKIAFAVMVEYGGSGGGITASDVAQKVLEACVEHGYLSKITTAE